MVSKTCAVLLVFWAILPAMAATRKPSKNGYYRATAYSVTGITASGEWTHRHVIAADPGILPLGSRVKIRLAGRYSGEYVVADTGAKVQGRHLDIYMPNTKECKRFGTRRVRVQVVEIGANTKASTERADQVVKQEVDKDIAKGVVGNSATETDWNAKGATKTKEILNRAGRPATPPSPAPK